MVRIEKTAVFQKRVRGFALLEVLIAFTVLTISASIMLEQMHAIMKYTERARAKQLRISDTLNQANMFPSIDWRSVNGQLSEREFVINRLDEENKNRIIAVRNFVFEQVDVPMTVAFSPFQEFDFGGDGRFGLRLLQPGLLPELNSSTSVIGRKN